MSHSRHDAEPPAAAISSTTAHAADSFTSQTSTCAPCRANRSDIALPMPEPPPVTMAVFSFNENMGRVWKGRAVLQLPHDQVGHARHQFPPPAPLSEPEGFAPIKLSSAARDSNARTRQVRFRWIRGFMAEGSTRRIKGRPGIYIRSAPGVLRESAREIVVEAGATTIILASAPPPSKPRRRSINSSTQSNHESCHSEPETKSAGRLADHRHVDFVLMCPPAATATGPGNPAGAWTRSATGSADWPPVLGPPPMLVGPPLEMVTAQGPAGSHLAHRVDPAGPLFGLAGFDRDLAGAIFAYGPLAFFRAWIEAANSAPVTIAPAVAVVLCPAINCLSQPFLLGYRPHV